MNRNKNVEELEMPSKKANQNQRKRGKDKARRSFELNGKYSAKHLRAKEALMSKAKQDGKVEDKKQEK